MLDDYREHGYEVCSFSMHTASRVIVGLGAESVLETSIRLHRIYGFPIIPGSALKGLARSFAELIENKNETDATFAAVFGKSPPDASAGQVIFFDAVPADPERLQLDLDVMNPHYSQYYQGGNIPPADYLNPIPVFFLAIAPDSEFLFAVASRKPRLAQQAQSWLQAGLQEMGVGAKTTVGYGLWKSQQHQTITATSESIEETQADSEREKKPDYPEPIERITPKTERIPAQVLDNSRNPIRVRLLAKGYENEVFECYGVRNLSSFPPGTYIWVKIAEFDKKTQRIRKVSLAALWRP
ncbi:type III-B CRISPR module RAMP protein Cmr6 [Rhodothermus profundi]|nr:type III-B CRISPR module RAMP protein Cmr6 [Rhodothermus profundi]